MPAAPKTKRWMPSPLFVFRSLRCEPRGTHGTLAHDSLFSYFSATFNLDSLVAAGDFPDSVNDKHQGDHKRQDEVGLAVQPDQLIEKGAKCDANEQEWSNPDGRGNGHAQHEAPECDADHAGGHGQRHAESRDVATEDQGSRTPALKPPLRSGDARLRHMQEPSQSMVRQVAAKPPRDPEEVAGAERYNQHHSRPRHHPS